MSTDSFTYSSGLNNLAFSRLDPFLVFDTWESHFDGVIQCILPKPISDHSPILLDGVAVRNRPIPFRFENMQLKVEGFKNLVKGWWSRYHFPRSFSFILASKHKSLKSDLKRWNKDVFGNVSFKKDVAFNEIGFWDAKEREGFLTTEEADAKRQALGDYGKWALFKEISCRQKSR